MHSSLMSSYVMSKADDMEWLLWTRRNCNYNTEKEGHETEDCPVDVMRYAIGVEDFIDGVRAHSIMARMYT
jgi:hypothetical protein